MNLAIPAYLFLYILSLIITSGISVFAWKRRSIPSASKFAIVAASQSLWILGNIFEIVSTTLERKIFWDNLQNIPIFLFGITLLAFSIDYCDFPLHKAKSIIAWLLIPPVITVILIFTLGNTELVHANVKLIPDIPFSYLGYDFTFLTKLGNLYTLTICIASLILFIGYFFQSPPNLNAQTGTILAGILLPIVPIALLWLETHPNPRQDITPLAFAIGDLVVAWGFHHFKLFHFSPVARHTIFEKLNDAVILLDEQNRIADLNLAAEKFVFLDFEAVIGQPAQDIIPFWEQLPDLSPGKQSSSVQINSPGIQKYYELTTTLLTDHANKFLGRLLIIRDVSEQKITAEMLKHRSSELEISNQELEEFAYSIAHDLRSPLRAMEGFGQILLDDYAHHLDNEGQDLVQRIRSASQHMAHLIDDLLLLSKVSRKELRIESVNLSQLAEKSATELKFSQIGRKVDFKITPQLNVVGDPNLLKIAIDNLFDNAWKFTHKRAHAIIELGYTEIDGAPTYFVRDNGVGFDMSYAEKLFKTFQRLHTPGEYAGTGIGLATVDRIIRRHRGRIWAESQEGQGATFYFTL